MRRLIIVEPYASGATLTRRLAALGCLIAALAVGASLRGLLPPGTALVILGIGLALAILAIFCAAAAAVAIWRTGHRGTGRVAAGLCLATLVLAYPGYLALSIFGQPLTREATTDRQDPPRFSLSTKAFAARGDLPAGPAARDAGAALPPVVLDGNAVETFAAVLKAIAGLRWRVVDSAPPGGRSGLGHIDAVVASPVMRLPDDVAIRIRPLVGQVRVDIRSRSRAGFFDFGSNARNVDHLAEALRDQADAEK